MAIEHKEIVDAIEESTKTLKRNFEAQRELDQKSFDQKIEKVISDLKETDLKDFQTKAQIEEFVKLKEAGLQKNFDEFAAKYKSKSAGPSQAKSFRKGLHDALAENHKELKSLSGSDSKIIQLKDMGFEDFNGYDIFTRDVQSRVIPTKEEAFHMRQILGSGATSGDTVYYPKATGKTGSGPDAWDYDKAVVANTVAKSDFEMTFDNVTAPVKWIAGILRIPKQMLDDLAWMQSYLATQAPIELLKAEDAQLLNGSGVGLNLLGLNTNATLYVPSDVAYKGIERIIDAAYGQMATNDQDTPTDVLLSPRDIVSIILNKASTSGEFNLPNGVVGVVNGILQIAGLNVQKTNKITAGNFLVGDFARGANLVTRMAPQLRAFEQDRDNVQKNMITFRIEERIALPIFYDEAFVKGTLASGT
jgi:HK97 family phage major capsid protein